MPGEQATLGERGRGSRKNGRQECEKRKKHLGGDEGKRESSTLLC